MPSLYWQSGAVAAGLRQEVKISTQDAGGADAVLLWHFSLPNNVVS